MTAPTDRHVNLSHAGHPSSALPVDWAHYLDKWLAVQPQQRAALVFVDPHRYPGHVALAALEQEWLRAAYGIVEPQVAAAKLNWWIDELTAAPTSGGRHPLTQVLFRDPRATCIEPMRWIAPLQAAMAQLEQGTATDLDAQLATATPLHGALAALETAWWYGSDAGSARAARFATLGHLLHSLRRLQDDAERDRLPLPMTQLARHRLDRSTLRHDSTERTQAIRAQLRDLARAWQGADNLPGPLSVFRTTESQNARLLLRRALASSDPLATLQAGVAGRGFAATFAAWHAARQWVRNAPRERAPPAGSI